jgi:hypothetical protein
MVAALPIALLALAGVPAPALPAMAFELTSGVPFSRTAGAVSRISSLTVELAPLAWPTLQVGARVGADMVALDASCAQVSCDLAGGTVGAFVRGVWWPRPAMAAWLAFATGVQAAEGTSAPAGAASRSRLAAWEQRLSAGVDLRGGAQLVGLFLFASFADDFVSPGPPLQGGARWAWGVGVRAGLSP